MILAGDVGATKTIVALFEETDEGLLRRRESLYVSRDYPSLESIVASFLADGVEGGAALGCFGVPGPVLNGRCRTTNLPWEIDEQSLAEATQVPRFKLLNDMVTAAYGMLFLEAEAFCLLQPGAEPYQPGNVAVIAPGTGLGEAILFWDGTAYHPIASEGGHTDFAARDAEEVGLLENLRRRYGRHVSYERVLSGPGIADVYAYLRQSGSTRGPSRLNESLRGGDPSAAITESGIAGTDAASVRTLELFVSVLGAEAGNLALKCLALGGVIIGGGIAPKILPVLRGGRLIDAFKDKGRFAELLQRIPVKVALDPGASLLGAARYALRLG